MSRVNPETVRKAIRDVPNFPKAGILFRDITPVLGDPALFRAVIDELANKAAEFSPSKIIGIDARGFVFGAAVAYKMNLGFVLVRKRGKLPHRTVSVSYALEYGNAEVEIHEDAISPGEKVVLVDDLLATGGTAAAAVQLVHQLGGEIGAALFFIELTHLLGRSRLAGVRTEALVQFMSDDE